MNLWKLFLVLMILCDSVYANEFNVSAIADLRKNSKEADAPMHLFVRINIRNLSNKDVVLPTAGYGDAIYKEGNTIILKLGCSLYEYRLAGKVKKEMSALSPVVLRKNESVEIQDECIWPADSVGEFFLDVSLKIPQELQTEYGFWTGVIAPPEPIKIRKCSGPN